MFFVSRIRLVLVHTDHGACRCNGVLDRIGKEIVERKKGVDLRARSWINNRVRLESWMTYVTEDCRRACACCVTSHYRDV